MENSSNITPSCGAVILNGEDEVVLVEHLKGAKHISGVFGLPAGKIEQGETALEAVTREVFEETGLVIAPDDFKKLSKVYMATIEQKDAVRTFSFEVFVAHVSEKTLKSSEETKPCWVPIKDIEGMNLLPNVADAIQEAEHMLL